MSKLNRESCMLELMSKGLRMTEIVDAALKTARRSA